MTVFVMMPYENSFRQTYKQVIFPVIQDNDLESVLAESQLVPGPIDEQIIKSIKASSFCIADLTEGNPNVMYEVAYAHSLGKSVILITRGATTDIPFDIRHHRALNYTPTSEGYELLYQKLDESIKSILKSDESTISLLRKAIVPLSIESSDASFVIAASPLSYRVAYRTRGGWKKKPSTFSDHVGIRGLMRSFGLVYGLERFPELVNPDDFSDEVLEKPELRMNLYTIGSTKANRWTGILMNKFFENRNPKWEFKPDPESKEIMNPRVIVRRNRDQYMPHIVGDPDILKWDFGLVIRGPHPMIPKCMLMVLAGRGSLGTEASCLAMTDPDCLKVLNKRLRFDGIELDKYEQAFCAIVSVKSSKLETNKNDFKVLDVVRY